MSELVERHSREKNLSAITDGGIAAIGPFSLRSALRHVALIVAFLLLFGVVLFGPARIENHGLRQGSVAAESLAEPDLRTARLHRPEM